LFQSLTSQYRGAISDTADLVAALDSLTGSSRQTLEMLDRLVLAKGASGYLFDIRAYSATLEKLIAALQEANRLAFTTAAMVDKVEPQQFDVIARGGAAHAQSLAAGVIDRAFWRAVALIILFFVMLALYRVFSARFGPRAGPK
jgi:hypothetical protein